MKHSDMYGYFAQWLCVSDLLIATLWWYTTIRHRECLSSQTRMIWQLYVASSSVYLPVLLHRINGVKRYQI